MGRHFATDCEGPISKNDNAQELAAHFIPKGETFFAHVSKYDDLLADVIKRPGYKAGGTLKLILPFLIAFGATHERIQGYSRSHILLVPGAPETLRFVREHMASFIISTSYQPYIEALCEAIGFPMSQVFFTQIDVDRYTLEPEERAWLKKTALEVIEMERLQWHEGARRVRDLAEKHQGTVKRLNEIFWRVIPKMEIGRVFEEVNPVGGIEKAKALRKSLEGTGRGLEDVMYVGDSITDVEALNLVRKSGGLAVSFNGNGYAVRSSQVCCMSGDARVIAVLADAFNRKGREGAFNLVSSWAPDRVEDLSMDDRLLDWLHTVPREDFPGLEFVSEANQTGLTLASERFRKQVRGVQIAELG
jgi:energy-converting hydrogenase A subunit R